MSRQLPRLGLPCMIFALLACMGAPAFAQGTGVKASDLKSSDLDAKLINEALDRGVEAVYSPKPQLGMEPEWTFPSEWATRHGLNYETLHATGNQALAVWALLRAGESYQNPPLYKRINWVVSSDTSYTYDRGIRATMLNELPHERWDKWIRRDGVWLTSAITDQGNFTSEWAGGKLAGPGDNASGQYAVLGLMAIEQTDKFPIPGSVWQSIDKYWRSSQQPTDGEKPAGWAVTSFKAQPTGAGTKFYSRVSGPMTAGAVAALSLTERYLYGPTHLEPSPNNVSIELRKGIKWLDENFSLDDKDEAADWYYYAWTIQRVGSVTGYRRFNGVDWFRDVTARIIAQQRSDGTWIGDKGRLLSTGFAILYLTKANDPMAISKLRLKTTSGGRTVDAAWNNRPNDIKNFVDYASGLYEVSTTWQIAEATQPPFELIESPLMYLATDQAFSMTDDEVANIRTYIESGGILVCNPEDKNGNASKSFKELASRLFPTRELEKVPKEHPFYDVHQKLSTGVQMQMVQNGIRPLIVVFNSDISRGLQANDIGKADGFVALSNIYLYATGMNPRRTRLDNNFIVKKPGSTSDTISVARIKFSGSYDPEPNALRQIEATVANRFNIDMKVATVEPKDLKNEKLAFLTTTGVGSMNADEAAAIRKWVEAGGTLWIDAAGGSKAAFTKAREFFTKIMPNAQPAQMASDNPILSGQGLPGGGGFDNKRVKYRYYALVGDAHQGGMGPVYTPRLQYVDINNRTAIVYSSEDLTCGMAGLEHHGIFGYTTDFARRIVVNGVLLATLNPTPNPQ